MRKFLLFCLFFTASYASAKQFEIFDGQIYNGKFYPLVDIIEWGEADGELPHMEFHLHGKKNPFDLAVVPGDKNGKPVLWVMYDLKFRSERICRHVLAPAHFKEGMPIFTYRDNSDPDYDNIYVFSEAKKDKKLQPYKMPNYEPCLDEDASNKPDAAKAASALPPVAVEAKTASTPPAKPVEAVKKEGKNIGQDYDNHAVPFSF